MADIKAEIVADVAKQKSWVQANKKALLIGAGAVVLLGPQVAWFEALRRACPMHTDLANCRVSRPGLST